MTMCTHPGISASADLSAGLHLDLHLVEEARTAIYKVFRRFAEARSPRGPEAGDVLYWFACLGAACLLMITTS